ncbi:MAG: flagellar hook-associated protein FlgK [Candidatus Acidulodesulfobacterium acidiphilum]|uniref:Flagellar hook-associated protein 1 n=1 Tax=Candidatus Acidulodesulfobacterium acidiphilum TaxID=2597224 RepID=A0A520XDY3_9DELT|nr:MAG: flagellar hook-associated protein FlgK [Candidatus Acidulodesulfobacterium acidiphilum]
MITVNNILDIADSAMNANTAAMNTVSQNVANVNTPFYNSETPIETEAPAVVGAPYTYGTGVNVNQIQRSTDNFVQSEVNNETGQNSYYTTLYQGLDQIQNLFNDQTGSGFSSQISKFFNDFQNVANNPSNTSQRTALLSDAQSLTGSIKNAYTTIQNTVASTNNSIQGLIPEINNLTAQIAGLNKQITYAINAGSNANELQDEQANAINSLSKLVNISYYTNNNGKTNIALGNMPLVSSDDSFNLSTQVDPTNPENLDVMWTGPNGSAQSVTSQITGGTLGAYVNLEQNVAPSYINQLNSLAASVTDNVNSLQYNGYGLDGSTGNYFFTPDLKTAVGTNSAGTAVTDATISTGTVTNPADLTGDKYTIQISSSSSKSATFNITDNTNSSNKIAPQTVTPTQNKYGQSVYTLNFDGVSVNITGTSTSGTAPAKGDTFTVNQLTTAPAFTMAVNPNLTTSQVAAASAVSTAVNPNNTGDATISAGAVINPTDVTNGTTIANSNEGGQYTIKYTPGGTGQVVNGVANSNYNFTVTNTTTGNTQYLNINPTTNSNGQTEYSVFFGNQTDDSGVISAQNFHVTLTGTPQNGDTFTANVLSPQSTYQTTGLNSSNISSLGLSGNNENALALGALQNNNLPINGTSSTISTYYSNIVSNIGTQAKNANTNYTNSTSVLTNLQNQLQSFVGVNMNQQMTNLVNYQNSYQAAAAITSSVQAIMTALLNTVP